MKPENILPAELLATFREHFLFPPQFGVVSPGRVNLIGEHTDYNNLPVLPTAIGRAIRVAVSPNNRSEVLLLNDSHQFTQHQIDLKQPITAGPGGDWGNYVRAPIHRLFDRIEKQNGKVVGFDAVLQSDLPTAAGLSSSSALVIATCLSFMAVNNFTMPAEELAEEMRLAECFVGTASGGMDQAVISLGQPGQALLIDFAPLEAKLIPLPAGAMLYAIQSCEKADKSGEARWSYNRRAFECLIGMELLRAWALKNAQHLRGVVQWTSLRDAYASMREANLSITGAQLSAVTTEPYTIRDLSQLLGNDIVEAALRSKQLPASDKLEAVTGIARFQIFARLQHIVSETNRVYQCAEAFQSNDLAVVATLMNSSHASCRDLYHISTPTIENLVAVSQHGGAMATRITGAGFGGCVIALVEAEKNDEFLERMRVKYFNPHKAAGKIPKHLEFENTVIACEPKGGAKVFAFD